MEKSKRLMDLLLKEFPKTSKRVIIKTAPFSAPLNHQFWKNLMKLLKISNHHSKDLPKKSRFPKVSLSCHIKLNSNWRTKNTLSRDLSSWVNLESRNKPLTENNQLMILGQLYQKSLYRKWPIARWMSLQETSCGFNKRRPKLQG